VVKAKLEQLAQRHGARFTPKEGWDHPALTGDAGIA
jgi:3-hydroxyacyl-CoA dehydrogenase/enoyl-CoA hydratase/3-hydroxybutyryl-CoA epimerase